MQKGTYLSILLQHFGLDKMPLHAAKQIGCFIDMSGYPGCSQAEETVVMRFTLVKIKATRNHATVPIHNQPGPVHLTTTIHP